MRLTSQAISSSRLRATRRQFVSPSVHLTRLKSRYMHARPRLKSWRGPEYTNWSPWFSKSGGYVGACESRGANVVRGCVCKLDFVVDLLRNLSVRVYRTKSTISWPCCGFSCRLLACHTARAWYDKSIQGIRNRWNGRSSSNLPEL